MARNAEKIAEIDKYLYFLSKDFFQSKSRNAVFQSLFEIFEGNITNVIEFMASYSVSVTQREKKTGKIFFQFILDQNFWKQLPNFLNISSVKLFIRHSDFETQGECFLMLW